MKFLRSRIRFRIRFRIKSPSHEVKSILLYVRGEQASAIGAGRPVAANTHVMHDAFGVLTGNPDNRYNPRPSVGYHDGPSTAFRRKTETDIVQRPSHRAELSNWTDASARNRLA